MGDENLHLLLKLKYKELLTMAKSEDIPVKGKKRQVSKILLDKMDPDKIREYFTKFSGISAGLLNHELIPQHEILSKEDGDKLLVELGCEARALPKILDTDPAVLALKARPGNIIRIKRNSTTAGWSYYYRVVVKHVSL